jgi:hypothetical protein
MVLDRTGESFAIMDFDLATWISRKPRVSECEPAVSPLRCRWYITPRAS